MSMHLIKINRLALIALALLCSISASQVFANSAGKLTTDQSTTERNYVDKKDPYFMIKTVAGKTFKRFADEQRAIRVNPNLLKDIVREELMPYINYKYSAFKVIGKHLKKTTAQERKEFVPVFREYLITSYAQVFTLYDNQPVEF